MELLHFDQGQPIVVLLQILRWLLPVPQAWALGP